MFPYLRSFVVIGYAALASAFNLRISADFACAFFRFSALAFLVRAAFSSADSNVFSAEDTSTGFSAGFPSRCRSEGAEGTGKDGGAAVLFAATNSSCWSLRCSLKESAVTTSIGWDFMVADSPLAFNEQRRLKHEELVAANKT